MCLGFGVGGWAGIVNEHLREFLEMTAVKPGKKSKYQLGVAEPKLGGAIQEALNMRCVSNDVTAELLRGVRLHLDKLVGQFKAGDLAKAQLGLGHSFSRAKVRPTCERE
jgi:nucleolar protein 56